MSDGATTTKSKLYVGLAKWLGTVALLVYGGVQISGPLNVQETVTQVVNGTLTTSRVQTGVTIKLDGVTVRAIDAIPLTMTGGAMNYDLAYVCTDDYGISGSGILLGAGVAWISNPANAKVDITYMKSRQTASGALNRFVLGVTTDNMTIASGATLLKGVAFSGSLVANGMYSRWNGVDCIAVKSLTNPTSSGSGYLIIEAMDDVSE